MTYDIFEFLLNTSGVKIIISVDSKKNACE